MQSASGEFSSTGLPVIIQNIFDFLGLSAKGETTQMKSISRFELLAASQALVGDAGLSLNDVAALPADPKVNAFESAAVHSYDASFLNSRLEFAGKVAGLGLRSRQVMTCQPQMVGHAPWAGCVRDIAVGFASRAFRRQVTSAEEAAFANLYEANARSADAEIAAAPVSTPVGYLDYVRDGLVAFGWSVDPAWVDRTMEIHFYVDGVFAGNTFANLPRPDVNLNTTYTGDHGFAFRLPPQYADGRSHVARAYAIGGAGNNPQLINEITFTTSTPGAVPAVPPQIGTGTEEGLRAVFLKVLMSPAFQLRPLSVSGLDTSVAANYQIANHLSWFLTGTLPDSTLLENARQGRLTNREVYRSEVERLLNANTERFAMNVFGQWMGFRDLALKTGVSSLEQSMVRESTLVFKEIIDKNLSPEAVLEPGFTYLNPELARHYGLTSSGTGFARVATAERGGILTQGSVLRVSSPNADTKPIVRGKWVQWSLLCRTIPSPSADLFQQIAMVEQNADPNWSVSERLEHHRKAGAACYGCHQYMDPLGLALENYAPLGNWRDVYSNGKPVVADGVLGDAKFKGVKELTKLVRERTDYDACFASRLLTHGLARSVAQQDLALLNHLTGGNLGVRDMIVAIANSDAFLRAAKGEL